MDVFLSKTGYVNFQGWGLPFLHILKTFKFLKLLSIVYGQWMIAQMVEWLLCTRRTRVQIPAPAPYGMDDFKLMEVAWHSG